MKRLVGMGDSIMHGTCSSEPYGLVERNFLTLTGKSLDFYEILNYGVNGTTVCTDTDWRPTLAACAYVDEINPADLAIIACGTNDYGKNVEIGAESDETEKTFCGALNKLLNKAKKRFKKIVFVTPIKRKNEDKKNEKGYTLSDYRNAIKSAARKFGVYVVDGELIPLNFDEHIPDGLHPNGEGHKVYAKYLTEKLKNIIA